MRARLLSQLNVHLMCSGGSSGEQSGAIDQSRIKANSRNMDNTLQNLAASNRHYGLHAMDSMRWTTYDGAITWY